MLRYQQAFINYGSHDNQRLMLEYGFVAPCNPHSVVYVDKGTNLYSNIFCNILAHSSRHIFLIIL